MSQHFSCTVSTALPRDRVWELFANIENWGKFSDVYEDLRWAGAPWSRGSWILGKLCFPHTLPLRYVLETCQPGSQVSYVAFGGQSGFATHRTVRFETNQQRTFIEVDSYIVGTLNFAIAGGGYGFMRTLTERWFRGFASFCDIHAETARLT